MRACVDCGRRTERTRCTKCERERVQTRKAAGLTGERGSTHESRQRRERVLDRDRHVCRYCGTKGADIADHYVPLALEGADDEDNMVAACGPCNSAKSDQHPDVFLSSDWLRERRRQVAAVSGSPTSEAEPGPSHGGEGGRRQNVA